MLEVWHGHAPHDDDERDDDCAGPARPPHPPLFALAGEVTVRGDGKLTLGG
jgi:hypothetical protein